jgi:hypothetical protein
MGFGNLLLLAKWAREGAVDGERRWILGTPGLEPWLQLFPGLRDVVLRRDEIRLTDQRVMPWSAAARAKGAARTVASHEQLDLAGVEDFISAVLLPGSVLSEPAFLDSDPNHLVINVRRGDYYSVPEVRAQYGFDVTAYLRCAVERATERDGSPSRITVVSDDVEWCRTELGWLLDVAPVAWSSGQGALNDFQVVAAARRLVITNSTFSYWAAHLGNVLRGDNHAQVWAPRFFDRSQNDGRSWLLDERWSVIEDLPGGWDLEVVAERSQSTGQDR